MQLLCVIHAAGEYAFKGELLVKAKQTGDSNVEVEISIATSSNCGVYPLVVKLISQLEF